MTNEGNLLFLFIFILFHCVTTIPQSNRIGYDTLEGGYSSRNWRNLYKHGSPSKKIGGSRKPFAQYGSASFYLQSAFGPHYVIGKVYCPFQFVQSNHIFYNLQCMCC